MTASPSAKSVLVVSRRPGLVEQASTSLRTLGYQIDTADTLEAARRRVSGAPPALIALDIDVDAEDGGRAALGLLEELHGARHTTAPKVLGISIYRGAEQLRKLFGAAKLRNLLTVTPGAGLDELELGRTVEKILGERPFGPFQYLDPDGKRLQISVRDSRDKGRLVEEITSFFLEAGAHARVAEGMAAAADELLTNALYNAPTGPDGARRYAHFARNVPVQLEAGEAVTVSFGSDGKRLCLGAADPFGSLSVEQVVDYLAKCFAKGADQVDTKAGGAGLSFYTLFNLVHHLAVSVAPGKQTEVVGLVRLGRNYREFVSAAKGFNLFVAD